MIERQQRLLHEALTAAAVAVPDKHALVTEGAGRTYGELADAAACLCAALQKRGVSRGDRVVIHLENGWACAVAIFGVLQAGAVMVVVNPQTRVEKLGFIVEDCGAAVLITSAPFARDVSDRIAAMAGLHWVITAGGDAGLHAPASEPFERLTGEEGTPRKSGVIGTDLAALIYTSGSTGEPKGVMHTHQSMVFAMESICEYLGLAGDDRILNVLPLAFDYGLYQLLMAVRLRATLLLERSFTYPGVLLQRLREEGVTVFPGVPTLFSLLRSMHMRKPLAFPSVRCVTNTAAALPPGFAGALKQIFPNSDIFAMYGLTECKRVSYLPPEWLDHKPMSVGRAIPGTEVMVLSDAGEPVAPGEIGVLHVRGPHVMQGYWRRPGQTAEMIKEGSWPGDRLLCTHDRFTVDEEGFLYFIGRGDDIIKSRGEKVSPAEVESVLFSVDGVQDAAVIGVPDPTLGEAVVACVVLAPGAQLSPADVRRLCGDRLEGHMVPQRVVFVDALPTTPNGKTDKRRLAQSVADGPVAETATA